MGPLEPNWCQVGEGMDEWMLFGEGSCCQFLGGFKKLGG